MTVPGGAEALARLLAAPGAQEREQGAFALALLARSSPAAHGRVFGELCSLAAAQRGAAAPLAALEPLYHAGALPAWSCEVRGACKCWPWF